MRRFLHDLVRQSASGCGTVIALTHGSSALTYEQLWRQVITAGAGLQRIGLARNDRVAVFLEKRIETVVSIFGTSAAGGAFVPINPLLKPRQVAYILADCDVRVLITSKERYELLEPDLRDMKALDHVVIIGELQDIQAPATRYQLSRWTSLVDDVEATPVDRGVIDVDMAAIFYTSGSTGSPKGVVVSHRNFICGAESVATYLGNNASDVILAALP